MKIPAVAQTVLMCNSTTTASQQRN